MFQITTDRLIIRPLDKESLELCICNHIEMEKTLGLNITGRVLDERQKNVYKIRLSGVKNNLDNYMWYTVWLIVLKEENKVIGSAMLKGYPNEDGEAVVGYAIEESYRCRGYMTEVLTGMLNWIFQNPDAKSIVADTLKDNVSSHRVLQKIGMAIFKEDHECYWWKLQRSEVV